MLKLASAIFLFGFFKSNLSIKSYLNLFGSLVLLFLLLIKKVSIFISIVETSYLERIDLIKLLYTVLVNTFDLYNEYNICLNSFLGDLELFPASI